MKQEKVHFDHPENLLSEFEYATYEQWKAIAESSLKGKPFDKIITKALEGFEIHPIYNKDDADKVSDTNAMPGFYPFGRGDKADGYLINKWNIAQEIPYPTPTQLNSALKNDLEKGQTAISIIIDDTSKRGKNPNKEDELFKNGTSIFCTDDYAKILEGIDIPETPVYINAGLASIDHFSLFLNFLKNKNIDKRSLVGGLFFDPIAIGLDEKYRNVNINALYKHQSTMMNWVKEDSSDFRILCVDTAIYHEAGADAVQEVAYSLATGTQHLRSLQDEDLSIDDIAGKLFFNVAFGPAFFIEIAKMRAMRKLWAKVVKEFGGNEESGKFHLFARTSKLNKSRLDQYVNLLRNTTEALSAILSGCDYLHVEFFDEPFGAPSDFSRRVARNIQLVLMEECNLPEVIDPVGGTWFVEKLTDEIAEKAWGLFLEIEKQGGMIKAIESGSVQNSIEEKAKERLTQLALRKDILVGTNKYPNNNEKEAKPLEYDYEKLSKERINEAEIYTSTSDKDTLAEAFAVSYQPLPNSVKSLKPLILCEVYEDLRDKSVMYKKKTGSSPKVFLANIGTVKEYKGRADFSSDFFSVGGFDIISKIGNENWEEVAKEAIESQAEVITICSTDLKYPEFVPQFCRLIKRAKPMTILVLAGLPKEHIEDFKAAGLDDFIHIKSNIVETLNTIFKNIGV